MAFLSRITFGEDEIVESPSILVAIGPNNGGKSRLLREIVSAIAEPSVPRIVVQSISAERTEVVRLIQEMITQPSSVDEHGNYALDGPSADLSTIRGLRPNRDRFDELLNSESGDHKDQLLAMAGQHFAFNLTTEQRLVLVKRKANTDESARGMQSVMHAAFEVADEVIDAINAEVRATFGHELVVDKSEFAVSQFRIKDPDVRVDRTNRGEMEKLERLDDQGDGIRAFSGICVCAALVRRPVMAVDEPEAFLHPPQAYAVGRSLVRLKADWRQLILATHSAEALRGLLSQTQALTVIRCSRSGGGFLRRQLDPVELKKIADDPVLSSERVLDGLFYDGVIIVESDGDAILYRRVLEQLGYDGVFHFVNSYSKAASAKVASPYAATGVPFAVVVDFDAIRIPDELRALVAPLGGDWALIGPALDQLLAEIEASDTPDERIVSVKSGLVDAIQLLDSEDDPRSKLKLTRTRLSAVRDVASVWHDLKRRGQENLSDDGKAHFKKLDKLLRALGIFVVPIGEREAWLGDQVPYTKNKNAWTANALSALASPLPEDHPLRNFVEQIVTHCRPA